jgi:hypothetical protein
VDSIPVEPLKVVSNTCCRSPDPLCYWSIRHSDRRNRIVGLGGLFIPYFMDSPCVTLHESLLLMSGWSPGSKNTMFRVTRWVIPLGKSWAPVKKIDESYPFQLQKIVQFLCMQTKSQYYIQFHTLQWVKNDIPHESLKGLCIVLSGDD